VLDRHGVEDVLERAGRPLHLAGIAAHDHVIGAVALAFLDLGLRAGEQRDLGAHGLGELDPHVPETTHADHADPVAGLDADVTQRRA
jgi:hypothetical protein